jgi:hypothetical protein
VSVRRPLTLIAALACVAALGGCGGSRVGHPQKVSAAPTAATVRTANCRLWRVLGQSDRMQLVEGLRAFFGGKVDSPGARGQVLPDGRAYGLLTGYCSQPFASAFMLYRLYGNAAAFTATS